MIWFDRLFPVFMVVHPLVFTLFVKTRNEMDGETRRRYQSLGRRMVFATLLFLALHGGVQAALEATQANRNLLRAAWPTLISVVGCIVLWTGFAGPVMIAKNSAFSTRPQVSPTASSSNSASLKRSASLAPRHMSDPIGKSAWVFGWCVFVICAGVSIWSIVQGAPAVLLLGCGWWVGMAVCGARQSLTEAEPRDTGGSQKVAEAYRSLRSFRAWTFYAMGLTGTVVFSIVAVVVLLWPSASGMLGGILGSTLGLAGGVFGVVAAFRRVRVNELLIEAERESSELSASLDQA
jgi:hypothetical protein